MEDAKLIVIECQNDYMRYNQAFERYKNSISRAHLHENFCELITQIFEMLNINSSLALEPGHLNTDRFIITDKYITTEIHNLLYQLKGELSLDILYRVNCYNLLELGIMKDYFLLNVNPSVGYILSNDKKDIYGNNRTTSEL